MKSAVIVCFLCLLLSTAFTSPSNAGDTLTPRRPISDDGSTLTSDGGRFQLGFFSPVAGSPDRYIGIWYNISARTVVWVANRGRPITGRSGHLSMSENGSLLLTDGRSSTIYWSSSSPALVEPEARLLDSGNFVVMENGSDPSSSAAWQSFDHPTDTLLPGMKLGWNLSTGLNRNLTSWATSSDPSPGDYVAGIDVAGVPQLWVWSGTQQIWRGGPWNGIRFSGSPAMRPDNALTLHYQFTSNSDETVYWFYLESSTLLSRLVLNERGLLERFLWYDIGQLWVSLGASPNASRNSCNKRVSSCGANGVCSPHAPTCTCLQGFRPKNRRTWEDGCERELPEADCRSRTDTFVMMNNTKLPDTSKATANRSTASLDMCRDWCLRNCSCTAYAASNLSSNVSGCLIWTSDLYDLTLYDNEDPGQDLYVRQVESRPLNKGLSTNSLLRRASALIIVSVVLVAFLLSLLSCWIWRRKKRSLYCDEEETEGKDLDLPLFDLNTIAEATNNFSVNNKLGQGGFGPVYKGRLVEGQEIAVKRLSKTSSQGVNEFKNEVMLIAKLQHRNLVRLLGCCIQGGERILVYEYMPNGSLDAFLFDEAKRALLDWKKCRNIILGIARGLLYLHQDSRLRIIHRDLKASNVLLDKEMMPKISDFGMARIFGGEDTEANTRRVVGTYGYMSPEYAMDGIFSVKSDVFSFGVLLLEIITGRKNRGVYHSTLQLNLLGHIWSLWKEGKVMELVNQSIDHSSSAAEILHCIKIALLCVQERPGDRPTMYLVLKMLDNDNIVEIEPSQPGFIDFRGPLDQTNSSIREEDLSLNYASMTMPQGR
ncbi:G-type lectin S-receptor-like serine/threonine-protein kinase At4g27290 [Zingiber officinale]|uniref:G-type lectin S-receptor-like serine/threonine-protein kinase At4g27290 n=1 Tax=Zingiber officinale TaxID=94328 RepID=UPI001C4A799B|nr:G-type lectin S-receptor-like serine/threonine-protein kinase At4g27290 [Zingiber officinale]